MTTKAPRGTPPRGAFLFVRVFVRAVSGVYKSPRKLELHRPGIAILGVLDQEHHQERDDRRGGVDDELPAVRVTDDGPECGPDDHERKGEKKCRCRADGVGHVRSEVPEPLARSAIGSFSVPHSS